MQVILSQNIANIGKKFDVKNVSDGYAKNYLIPKGLAIFATPEARRQLSERKTASEKKDSSRKEKLSATIKKLGDVTLTFPVRVNEEGGLFGSITETMVATELLNRGLKTKKEAISLNKPLKELGDYTATIDLGSKMTLDIKIKVTREE